MSIIKTDDDNEIDGFNYGRFSCNDRISDFLSLLLMRLCAEDIM